MAGKILKSILTVALIVLLTSFIVVTGILYLDFNYIQQDQRKDKLQLAAAAVEQMGENYLAALPRDDYRLTWISPEGTVLFDSFADIAVMENHSDREEVMEALSTGSGDSSRYSSTLTEKTFYEALRLSDGSVLRISVSRNTAAALLPDLLRPVFLIAVAAVVLSVWLARRMAKQVMEPFNQLNLDQPMENETYEELTPLLQRISSQHQEIELQMQLLKHKQQEFDLITNHLNEALLLLGSDHRILSMNPAAIRLFQMSSACVGKIFCSEIFEPQLSHAIKCAKEQGHSEFTASVNETTYLFNISSVSSEDSLHGIVILSFDITEQARAEQMRREFTANVSHELKTPLQAIMGSAELLEQGIVQPQDMARFVGHIRKESARLLHLIEDIIHLAQLDEENTMSAEQVSLLALANEVQESLRFTAGEKKISLSVSGDPGILNGVPSLLFELLYNLTDNAIRYNIEEGSVHISVSDEKERIHLRVSDTGIGISSEHHSKIFERFYRVDKSHSKTSGGTGLGLSIVKHIAKYHHGTVSLESAPGKGTLVQVTFLKI